MASITTYTSKDGSETFKVRYRVETHSCSTTFPIRKEAQKFIDLIDRWGPQGALEMIGETGNPRCIVCGPTVSQAVSEYICLCSLEQQA